MVARSDHGEGHVRFGITSGEDPGDVICDLTTAARRWAQIAS
jgi:hypothetical protein